MRSKINFINRRIISTERVKIQIVGKTSLNNKIKTTIDYIKMTMASQPIGAFIRISRDVMNLRRLRFEKEIIRMPEKNYCGCCANLWAIL